MIRRTPKFGDVNAQSGKKKKKSEEGCRRVRGKKKRTGPIPGKNPYQENLRNLDLVRRDIWGQAGDPRT